MPCSRASCSLQAGNQAGRQADRHRGLTGAAMGHHQQGVCMCRRDITVAAAVSASRLPGINSPHDHAPAPVDQAVLQVGLQAGRQAVVLF